MYHANRLCINDSWRFWFEDEAAAAAADPEPVTLPHTWNALDTMETDLERHYRRGVGWYETPLAAPDPHRRRFIHVEAAAMKAKVWFGERLLGEHAGGYTPFTLELPREAGTVRVAVDNRPDNDLIPSDQSDFFLFGGLTRNVWLYDIGPVRLSRLHFHLDIKPDRVGITASGHVDGNCSDSTLELTIKDEDDRVVSQITGSIEEGDFTLELPDISNPRLWSPERPALYTVNGRVTCDGELSDEVVERIGLRTFEFPKGGPFFLNGERLLLRGTHRHEDWAGCGSAVPDEYSIRELRQIKNAGFNFIRLGHYPQADAVLDACDELGLIVWEEIPWCRGGVGGERFKSQARQMLREMIEHHFNHPSIIFWGLGNELDWESDHVYTTDDDVFAFLGELHELSHRLDDSRLTALRRYDRGVAIVDVYSPSIWSGWYRGRYEDYEAVLLAAMERFPRLIHTEWGGDSHVGRHNSGPHLLRKIDHHTTHEENPGVALSGAGEARASLDGDWSESYMLDLMEWHLQVQNRLPKLAGTAQWVFKDFGTPLRPENPIPYVNQKGLVDRSGRPKDVYYVFQVYQTDTPVCYIESPTWPVRSGESGAQKRVRVYSNCERVELFINGRSQGTKSPSSESFPAGGLVWVVPMDIGDNTIQAKGVAANGQVIEHTIEQTLVPDGNNAVAMKGWLEQGQLAGEPAVLATIQLVTGEGVPVLDDERHIYYELEGAGRLLSNQGTPTGSRVVETANGRAAIWIMAPGPDTKVRISAEELPDLHLNLEI